MYTVKSIEEIKKDGEKYYTSSYKLCYIDDIPETISDWDEESKEIINSPGFSWKDNNRWYLRTKDYPNPEYIPGKSVYYAYFTPLSLKEQWGDDWNDSPYEYNAGKPYDHGDNFKEKIEILKIPFYINENKLYLPRDRGYNSPFCVEDINDGAIPWIFIKDYKTKDSDYIMGGTSVVDFIKIIEKWNKKYQ